MNKSLNEALDLLRPQVKKAVEKTMSEWHDLYISRLKTSTDLVESFQKRLVLQDIKNIDVFISEFEDFLKKYIYCCDNIQISDNDQIPSLLFERLENVFKEQNIVLDKTIKLLISEEFLKPSSNDGFRTKIWKLKCRTFIYFETITKNTGSGVLTVFGKKKSWQVKKYRKFSLRQFLETFYKAPLSKFLLNEWKKLVKNFIISILNLHEDILSVKKDKPFYELKCENEKSGEPDNFSLLFGNIKKLTDSANNYIEEFHENFELSKNLFNNVLEEIEKDMLVKWDYIGTFILPLRKINNSSLKKQNYKLEQELFSSSGAFNNHFEGEKSLIRKDVELLLLQIESFKGYLNVCLEAHKKIEQQIIPVFKKTADVIQERINSKKKTNYSEIKNLGNLIIDEKEKLLSTLRGSNLPEMMDVVLSANLEKNFNNYMISVNNGLNSVSEKHRIFKLRDFQNLHPKSRLEYFSIKQIILSEFMPGLINENQDLIDENHIKTEKIIRNISEIDQIVEYNIDAALNLLEKDREEVPIGKIINVEIEGLERAGNHIENIIKQFEEIQNFSREKLHTITRDFETALDDLTDNEKILELKIKLARAKTKEKINKYRNLIWKSLIRAVPAGLSFVKNLLKRLYDRYTKLRKIAGLEPAPDRIEYALTKYLNETTESIESLPYVYQRLFRIEPLTDIRFFEGHFTELEELKASFNAWQNGENSSTALIGEKGSGKTTLLNFAKEKFYQNFPVVKYNFNETIYSTDELFSNLKDIFDFDNINNLDDLEEIILRDSKKQIIIIENLHNLFIRTVDGFNALERFLLFILRTCKKIYWVATCSIYSWHYLDKILNISKFFQRSVTLKNLSHEDIEKIILKRHQISGFELEFSQPEKLNKHRKFKKLRTEETRQLFLKDILLDNINTLAGGNITAALLFWLRSIIEVRKEKIVLTPEINFDYSFLYKLSEEELFSLSAIILHEAITIDQHAKVFHQDLKNSTLLLKRMLNSGILIEKGSGFQVHPFLYKLVVNMLKSKNILH